MIILAEAARLFSYSETEDIIALMSVFKIYFRCYCISDLFFCYFFFSLLMYSFIKKRKYGSIEPIKLERAETTRRVYDLELSRTKEFALTHRGFFFKKKIRFPAVRLTVVNNRRSHFNKDRH